MVSTSKEDLFKNIENTLVRQGFAIVQRDDTRPWGGFFVIEEDQAQQFADTFFDGINVKSLMISGKLSPKILIVAPHKRLSWQYHDRRAEIWQVYRGEVGVICSDTDIEGEIEELTPGDLVRLEQGERHRLVGLNDWSVLAEIWQHTDPNHPSDEDDIVRVQDDFGR